MNNLELLSYFFKSAICYSILYLFYLIIFKKTSFFQLNRFYLLLIIPISLIIPVLRINTDTIIHQNFLVILPEISVNKFTNSDSFNWMILFWSISSVFFAMYLIKIALLIIKINKIKKGKKIYVLPFSFFNFIYIPNNVIENRSLIEEHEKVHVNHLHSIDIIIYELYKTIFWFNPFVWIAIKDVKTNHEYIADEIASKGNNSLYSKILVAQVLGVNCSDLVNNFNTKPLITKRIKMMKTRKTKKWIAISYTLIIPIVLFTIIGIGNVKVNAQENISQTKTEDKIYEEVDQMPEFKGGMEGLMSFLGKEIKYPEKAKKENEQGTVFISFVIDQKGKVKDTSIEKGVSESLNNEAKRVVNSMPKWTPGKNKGKLVSVKMVLPIKFQL